MLLENRVALVTGSSRGIGRSVALELARNGAAVAVTYAKEAQAAGAVAQEIRSAGGTAVVAQADVSVPAEAIAMVEAVTRDLGPVDILVNNAGITRDSLLLRMKEEDWDRVLSVNLGGVFNCTKVALRSMIKRRQGRIVNVSSIVGLTGNQGQANYSAAKAGIIGFTRSIAREVASRGITANVVAPGYIDTEMTEGLPEDAKEKMMAQIPLGRFGSPDDVARAVLFFASDLSSYVTGQVLVVDGGMVMA
ncbi:MAG: 3-oxoacyl-[acyl-carrier-protein] reductase [Bacillota bacterium]